MTKMVPEEFKIRVKQHLEAAHKNYLGMEKKKKKRAQALTGFEPVISCLLDRRFNQLSHRARWMKGMYKHVFNCCETFTALLSAGGVQVSAEEGKIKVVNTLESRLELLGGQVSKLHVLLCGFSIYNVWAEKNIEIQPGLNLASQTPIALLCVWIL